MHITHKPILFKLIWKETHSKSCNCTYCEGVSRLHFGLNVPKDWKAWNSWYVVKYWPKHYIRWTHRFLRKVLCQRKREIGR